MTTNLVTELYISVMQNCYYELYKTHKTEIRNKQYHQTEIRQKYKWNNPRHEQVDIDVCLEELKCDRFKWLVKVVISDNPFQFSSISNLSLTDYELMCVNL